jgi:YYY domain-containing protein
VDQLGHTISFWLLAELLGLVGLPFAAVLFARLPGRGLALARPLGILVALYPPWLLANLGLVSYGRVSVAVFVVLAGVAAAAVALRLRAGVGELRGLPVRLLLVGEALFTGAFATWALVRSLFPDVWQTEKPMDMAIVNAINRSDSFPPHDPWLSGHDLNYYYFGHYVVAALVRVTGVDPAYGYNLGLALFYALCACAVFAVGSAAYAAARTAGAPAVSPVVAGLTAVGFAVVLGNLAGGTQLLENGGPLSAFDWFAPSRVIDGTANEFPAFSFVLGDLHAHVMATPFALVVAALALQLALAGPASGYAGLAELALASLALGALALTNTLDFPTAALLGGLALVIRASADPRRARLAAWWVAWVGLAVLLALPFLLRFSPTTDGIGIVGDHDPFSRYARDIGLIFGLPLWVLAAAFVARLRMPFRYAAWAFVAAIFLLTLLAPGNLAGLVLILSATAVAFGAFIDNRLDAPLRFFWLLAAVGLGLVALGEVVFIRDVFDGTPSYRFNTVFKAQYQAWYLLAIAASCGLFWGARWLGRRSRRVWLLGVAVLAALAVVYPAAAVYSRGHASSNRLTLDGMRWLERSHRDDARAIEWLRTRVPGAPTIVESVGPDFDPNGTSRVSTFTGLPTVLGWAGHELQWGHTPGSRGADVNRLYETRDPSVARSVLRRYGVRYVFVGSLERAVYPRAGLRKFSRIGTPVFRSGATVVYRVG